MKTLSTICISICCFIALYLAFTVPLAMTVQANTPGQSSVALTWTDTDPSAVSFNVYRGLATGVCSGTPTPIVSGVATKAYTDASVTAGNTYFYAVSAVNSAGKESACSAEAQATVPSAPQPPSSLQGTAH
jgi:fibronectin type 3 domain-containing protein